MFRLQLRSSFRSQGVQEKSVPGRVRLWVGLLSLTFILVGCGGSDDVRDTVLEGTASKGPFEVGSTVTAYRLNADGSRSGESQTAQTTAATGPISWRLCWVRRTQRPRGLTAVHSSWNRKVVQHLQANPAAMQADRRHCLVAPAGQRKSETRRMPRPVQAHCLRHRAQAAPR